MKKQSCHKTLNLWLYVDDNHEVKWSLSNSNYDKVKISENHGEMSTNSLLEAIREHLKWIASTMFTNSEQEKYMDIMESMTLEEMVAFVEQKAKKS